MATIVLSVVGGLIGGPVGAAIGTALGQRIDQRLLGPKGRKGPRLNDLAVQTSSYGAQIPKIFGRMRVAGTVIWSTDLRETRRKQSAGKGQPKTTTYSYSASFAVALSARAVTQIGRIWADGKLLRGEAGDFKTPTAYRFHNGSEGQAIDPLIAAAEGIGQTPAYRGIAYAVFEDFQLGDYGNRIPSLSFEVIADEAPIGFGAILAGLTAGAVADAAPTLLGGFAASGDSVRGATEVLAGAIPVSLVDDGEGLSLREAGPAPVPLLPDTLGATAGEARSPRTRTESRPALVIPEMLGIAYYDPERDYQPGLQSARRDGGARRTERVDLPAALDAASARALAERKLGHVWAERLTARVTLPWRFLHIRPGARIILPDTSTIWRVAGAALQGFVVELDLVREADVLASPPADPGRPLTEADAPHGPTRIELIDLPPLDDVGATAPRVAVAAAGELAGWRRASLLLSHDGGTSWRDAGQTAAPAIMGTSETLLAPAASGLIDSINGVTIALLHDAMELNDADDAALLRGTNLAMLGDELIQFGHAEPLGNNRWRLSRLLRGRRGTRAGAQSAGERFVLIEAESLVMLADVPAGATLRVAATGIGDGLVPALAEIPVVGNAIRPLPPVHPQAQRLANGDTQIRWIRRSRIGWGWPDLVDVPLGEEQERYLLTLTPIPGSPRTAETSATVWLYTEADRALDAAGGATTLSLAIRQAGSLGVSSPVIFYLPLT